MINWAYGAGFFDGEGSLHMDRHKSTVQIRIDNTFKRAVHEIRSFVAYGTISIEEERSRITRIALD